ncbi:MAG: histidine kinase [Betaproteobacteria bacterium]|nr:histidine kinase [Betaproteobacteria bacterium]
MLRVIVIANLFVLAAGALRSRQLADLGGQFLVGAALAEPVLIVSLTLLCAGRRILHSLRYSVALVVVTALELGLAWAWVQVFGNMFPDQAPGSFARVAFFVLFVTGILLTYFDLRARALSPAIAQARIQALQARIRPHFLYNSINAVLSLIRSDPKRAERALEDLADMFRVLMADNRALAPLANEIGIARQYLAIEELRLGDRLRVAWRVEGMPEDAFVPAMLLQPLVENAVYHGIEPIEAGGEIAIEVRAVGEELFIRLTNPFHASGDRHAGNKMALANIRERLQLHFDAEASMQSQVSDGTYEVIIRLPYITAPR